MTRVPITFRADSEQKAAWVSAAHREELGLSAWMRRVLDRAAEVTGQEGTAARHRGGAATPGPDPSPEPGNSETLAPEPEPPAAEAPAQAQVSKGVTQARSRRLKDVLGSSGTISGTQSVKAIEAARMAQQREEMFSMVCPLRKDHTPGVRCPQCHGIS